MNSASPPSSPSGAERIAQFETNIGPDSRFESRWLILTAHGLSVHLNTAAAPALRPVESSGNAAKPLTNRSQDAIHPLSSDPFWKLEEIAEIRISDRNGIGFLSLLGHERLLAEWRFTANRLPAAEQFVVAFRSLVRSGRTDGEASEETVIPEAEDVVPVAVATSALLRLLKFARPRAPAILLGIVLTFATTLVGLVPSYLTMPLVDQVLIPPAAAPVVATPPAPPATVSSPTASSPSATDAKTVIAPARPLSPQQRLRMLMLYLAGLA